MCEEPIKSSVRIGRTLLWLSAIGLVLLLMAGGYFEYGEPGTVTAGCVIAVIAFVIWVDRTA
jgi:hypothetical protein